MRMAIGAGDWSRDIPAIQVISPQTKASALRRAVEISTRNLTLRARLPDVFGRRTVYVSPANALRFLLPGNAKFDPFLLWLVDRFVEPKSVVWDIGANGGIFSTAAATKAASVVAFEPDPFNIALIGRTLKANPDLDIRVAPVALSDRSGATTLNIPCRGRSVASIGGIPMGSQSGGVRETVPVQMMTADDCLGLYPPPAFIKCDIEGAEAMMLRGAGRMLREVRPTMCIEVRAGTRREVAAILARHDYRLHSADDAMHVLTDLTDVCDVIAVPA